MPAISLTEEQRRAIVIRGVSIALSAGAGCGKTHVLTERFLSHIEPGANSDSESKLGQFVAITFTDAAAREMRSRIRKACYDHLAAAATIDSQNHWLRLLREIDSARISTIHAFCASLLRTHSAAADLDPTFAVLDQSQAELIQFEVIDDVLRDELAKLDANTLDLAEAYGLVRLKQQVGIVLGRRHDRDFAKWLAASPEEIVTQWRDWHANHALPIACRQIAAEGPIDQVVRLLSDLSPAGMATKFAEARAVLLELLPRLKNDKLTKAELASIREYARVQTICSAKDWPSADDFRRYRDACKELRDSIDRHHPAEFDEGHALRTARLGLALLQLADSVVEQYEARKRAQGALDFDDLLSAAYRLISNPQNAELRRQIADDVRLLLVDEFQDTDQLQVDLVKALCGPGIESGRLFFVGDFKQSIYRFRGAAPAVFKKLQAEIKAEGRLALRSNFRSQPAILHFVNALFCDAFGRSDMGYEPLHAHREQTTELPAVEFLWTISANKNNRQKSGSVLAARRHEARAIARRIRFLIDETSNAFPIVDKKTKQIRRLQLGDVAILFRALSDVQVYEEALRENGLDYYLVGGHAFYAQQEIYDVLNLLRAIASMADEVSLAGVLRSPIFSLADETLFWLVDSCGSLNGGLLAGNLPPELAPEEQAKVSNAAATIRHLRSIKDRVPVAKLLHEALDRTGYDAVLLTEFLGQRKLANLHKLIEHARAADEAGTDLDGFITQLSQFIVRDPKESLAATLPEAANVIRLMTIHHAKGLEFPLVIIPDLDRRPLLTPPIAALHPELGPLVPAPAEDGQPKFATGMSLFAAAERAEELEERKRMLYVAATRAADYLILSSSLEALDKPQSDWMKLIADRFDLASGQLIRRLPEAFEPPSIRVTVEQATDDRPTGKSRGADLSKLLDESHQLAADDSADVPGDVGPIPVDHAARRTFSFSRLSGQLLHPGAWSRPIKPASATNTQGPVADPRGFGSLVHDALARIDFRSQRDIAEWCEHLAPQHVPLNAVGAAIEASDVIARFAESALGRQLGSAALLHREVEFILAWPPDKVGADNSYIRGYIDCLFQDSSGDWRIVDYKTDNIASADVPRFANRYEMQLFVYAMAAERALGRPPVDLALHFLRPGRTSVFRWNDEARRRAIELIDDAIARFVDSGTTAHDAIEDEATVSF